MTGAADLTAEWLTAALGTEVVALRTEPVGTGQVADTVRLFVDYAESGAGPPTLIAKVPAADEASRAGARIARTYEREAGFYRDLAASLPARIPRCYHVGHELDTDSYDVVLEDVAPARQGDQMAGCSIEQVASAIDELALFQAPRWGDDTLRQLGWLHRQSPTHLADTAALIRWAAGTFSELYREVAQRQTMDLIDEFLVRLDAYLETQPEPWTIVHGDFRADNLLFGGERVVVVDWQTVGFGPGPTDLAYLLGASLTPALRRSHEHELVDRYVDRLCANAVGIDRPTAWEGYRRFAFHGMIIAIASPALVRRTTRGDELFVTMADRHAQQAIDLDSLSLIGE